MRFRTRLFWILAITVLVVVALVSVVAGTTISSTLAQSEEQRIVSLAGQFRREFEHRSAVVEQLALRLSESETARRLMVDWQRPDADPSAFVNEATALAAASNAGLLSIVAADGRILSSAHWPARFGYNDEWTPRAPLGRAVLHVEELADGPTLGLVAVRRVGVGDRALSILAGERLDQGFLESLSLPPGMRVMLYRNAGDQFNPALLAGGGDDAARFGSLILQAARDRREVWSVAGEERVQARPLAGSGGEVAGVLLVAISRAEALALQRFLAALGVAAGFGGVVIGLMLAWWATQRVTRPVEALATAAGEVARGNWTARVEVESTDEIGLLAESFNQMTRELLEQKERLLQAERVAAWRELARRLAHELKNPLFPLQITVENLRRAREAHPAQFDEVFEESTRTLLEELANLRGIVARFSDFARMPAPQKQMVDLNEIVRSVARLIEAQLSRQQIRLAEDLEPTLPRIQADPEQLKRAIQNLAVNAIDAMPDGGTLSLRSRRTGQGVAIEVADTGSGLTPEECARLFTPYYTTKHHGTGLGLAIVQSVVSDHGGRIRVDSQPGRGATFRIDLADSNHGALAPGG